MQGDTKTVQRKLAAILAADIANYSALMGEDDVSTVQALKGHQAAILPLITTHEGRLIDTAGDGVLAEFASAVKAVECAIAIQAVMAERNQPTPVERRLQFRIGVNLGDILHDGQKLFGDGVNIAARLEGIAEPGGICISGHVRDQITGKIDVPCMALGAQALKNIAQEVMAFKIDTNSIPKPALPARPSLALPDRPSIVVLPFTNMSNDADQEYFSDGITEDIITELGRFSDLFVIARNSSFQYKGKAPDIRQVGRELGVRYVLEGSIRKAGGRARITAQLMDASTGNHRWAEKYDRNLDDVFATQDEIAKTVVQILAIQLNKAELERTSNLPPSNWTAYDNVLQANSLLWNIFNTQSAENLRALRDLANEALHLDSKYARAFVVLATSHLIAFANPINDEHLSAHALDVGLAHATKAISLDPELTHAYAIFASLAVRKRDWSKALAAIEKAKTLGWKQGDILFAQTLAFCGYFEEAAGMIRTLIRHDPLCSALLPMWLGSCHYHMHQLEDSRDALLQSIMLAPRFLHSRKRLAATYAQLGDGHRATEEAQFVMAHWPHYAIRHEEVLATYKNREDVEFLYDGLRKAGLPE